MEDLVEKVREALKQSFRETVAASAEMDWTATGVTMPADAVWERYARAAIEAMREPTGAMEDAAYNTRIPISHNGVHAVWQAMIDAALKQESR